MTGVLGIHHVTAIASYPQRNIDFYAGMLGLRFVKRTINFDDPQTYHFYYGDETGSPGSILTFFPWPGARNGRQGTGQVAVTAFAVLPGALGFWIQRLVQHGISYEGPTKRVTSSGAEQVISFKDHDGLMLEIVSSAAAERRPAWSGAKGIDRDNAIHGFHSVTIWVNDADASASVLTRTLGFHPVDEFENRQRYSVGDGGSGTLVDVRSTQGFMAGVGGAGTVHHVAWRVADDAAQLQVRDAVVAAGLQATPVIDRNYFHSVYFREPGDVLFELATDAPGFAVDEPVNELGTHLKLPAQYELYRTQLEASLPPIHLPE